MKSLTQFANESLDTIEGTNAIKYNVGDDIVFDDKHFIYEGIAENGKVLARSKDGTQLVEADPFMVHALKSGVVESISKSENGHYQDDFAKQFTNESDEEDVDANDPDNDNDIRI